MSPVYGYSCLDCGFKWEENHPIRNRDIPTEMPCPECDNFNVARAVGCGGFRLKGFCWSRDNYSRTVGDDPRGAMGVSKEVHDAE